MNLTIIIKNNFSYSTIINQLSKFKKEHPLINIKIIIKATIINDYTPFLFLIAFIKEKEEKKYLFNYKIQYKLGCEILNNLISIGFFKILNINTFNNIKVVKSPIIHIAPNTLDMEQNIKNEIKKCFDYQSSEDVIFFIDNLDELISNISLHSKSSNGGYYYYYLCNTNKVFTFVAIDNGLGIYNSLNNANPKDFSEESNNSVIIKSLDRNITSTGVGKGLYIIKTIVLNNNGTITITSGKDTVNFFNSHNKCYNHNEWEGAMIKINIKKKLHYDLAKFQKEYEI